MGCINTKYDEEKLYYTKKRFTEIANKKFNTRINNYNYVNHGNYIDYVECCKTQYKLDIMKFNKSDNYNN